MSTPSKLSRHASRELAFILLFEKEFVDEPVEVILQNAVEARDAVSDAFALQLASGAEAHLPQIDARIAAHSRRWNATRLSRVARALLRLAVYEMLYDEETPASVAINEAVELAKVYGGEDEYAFVNGVLGGVSRETGARATGAREAEKPDAGDAAADDAVPENGTAPDDESQEGTP